MNSHFHPQTEALQRFARYLDEAPPGDPALSLERQGPLRLWLGADENTAVYCGPPEDFGTALSQACDFFSTRQLGFEFKYTAWNMPADSPQQLAARGFKPGEAEQVLALAVATAVLPAPKEQLALRELSGAADFAQLAALQQSIWGGDFAWLSESLQREKAACPQALLIYGIYEGKRLVSAAWMRIDGDMAFFHGGATAPAWRGKGLYRELVYARLRQARARKLRWAFSEAVTASLPILQKMGFEVIGETRPYFWEGSGE